MGAVERVSEWQLERVNQIQRAREGLLAFTLATFPGYQVNWHHKVLCQKLNDFADGKIKRLIVQMPPRMGKSELVSRRLPAYLLGRDPSAKIITCSYADSLAASMNRDVQRIIDSETYKEIFPKTTLRGEKQFYRDGSWVRNSSVFEVKHFGGSYRSAGVGGSITGQGASSTGGIIIDDPVKNQEEADSEVFRNRLYEWFGSTLYTRLEKDAPILITMTRWHEDDLVGRLLKLCDEDPLADKWEIVSFPALCESQENPLDPRQLDDPLWPEKYSRQRMYGIKSSIGTRNWNALYQQRPAPEQGLIVQRHWWKYYQRIPDRLEKIIQAWDLTFTKSLTSDFVVGVVMGKIGADMYLLDMIRGRLSFTDTLAAFRSLSQKWPQAEAKYVEKAANGDALIDMLRSEIPGLIAVRPEGSKVARANACSPRIEAGNVHLPAPILAPWVNDVLEEWTSFPAGSNDDIVDAMCHGILKFIGEGATDYLPLSLVGVNKFYL